MTTSHLKGLTEDGAAKLIEIAEEVKVTKTAMSQEFSERADELDNQYAQIHTEMGTMARQVAEQVQAGLRQIDTRIKTIQRETCDGLSLVETTLREEHRAAQQAIEERVATQDTSMQKSAGVSEHQEHGIVNVA